MEGGAWRGRVMCGGMMCRRESDVWRWRVICVEG